MRIPFLIWIVACLGRPAFAQVISSAVYSVNRALVSTYSGNDVRTLLEGTTRDFSHLILQVITMSPNLPKQPPQELDEEAMLVIKSGSLTLTLGGKRKVLGPENVVVVMPGEKYTIENNTSEPLTYYLMRYTSNEMPDLDLDRLIGSSFWIDWQDKSSLPASSYATIMSNHLVIQQTKLAADSLRSTMKNRAAQMLFVLDQPIQVALDETMKKAQVGDVIFLESDVSYKIVGDNQGDTRYLLIQF
ncbi:hypothetical protein GCM10028807_36090 [Spirosoma daeguense]